MLLEMQGITKSFPGVNALEGVDLSLDRGEVVALIGENGAGKSTLMKVLGGIHKADSGKMFLDGAETVMSSAHDAMLKGVSLVHQELNLATNLDISENVFLGHEPRLPGPLHLMDTKKAHREAAEILSRIGLSVRTDTVVGDLSSGHKQLVEIARALSRNTKILVLDEPTSSLSLHETQLLFKVIRDLKVSGIGIIYISHRMAEVTELADRAVVLRDGKNSGELAKKDITHENMVRLMVGRDISGYYREKFHSTGDAVLEVSDLELERSPGKKVSFTLKKGEVLGFAGLVGAGRTEVAKAIFGLEPVTGGTISVNRKPAKIGSPADAMDLGLGYVPEDRSVCGLVLEMSVMLNVSLLQLRLIQNYGFWDRSLERETTRKLVEQLRIKTPNLEQAVKFLSGGNQQKVVMAKWLNLNPSILILDEPTRGVDVGAKEEIRKIINGLAESGVSLILISSELDEIIGMSDRAVVMHEGTITGELGRDELTEENIMKKAIGKAN